MTCLYKIPKLASSAPPASSQRCVRLVLTDLQRSYRTPRTRASPCRRVSPHDCTQSGHGRGPMILGSALLLEGQKIVRIGRDRADFFARPVEVDLRAVREVC